MTEKKEKFAVVEVATETQKTIVDSESNKEYDIYSLLAKIANDIEVIRTSIES